MNNVDLSIVVVSHNHRKYVEEYFSSIFDASSHVTMEVLLIDNFGRDGTAEWVKANFPRVSVITNSSCRSYAENVNTGIEKLKSGRFFVVINPDIKCMPGLWDEAVRFMDENPDVGLMGPKLLNPDLTLQSSCRRFSTPLTLLIRGLHLDGLLTGYGPIYEYLMKDYDHSYVNDVDWVTGALMVVRRSAIDDAGRMDERYEVAYSEDQDWCCSMWRSGWRVCYAPQAVAVHDHIRTGMTKPWSRMARMQLINAVRMFRKFDWKLTR